MIDGFEIGHHTADGDGWLTGTTVVLARDGAVGGVDVRGGGPGTRETDLLDPTALVERVHAVVLTGGSAYGLAAADGVMAGLEARASGSRSDRGPGQVVPIVPAAVIFDLGRGGDFGHRPTADFGRRPWRRRSSRTTRTAAASAPAPAPSAAGSRAASATPRSPSPDGRRVAAAVVVNAAGSAVDPADRAALGRPRAAAAHARPRPSARRSWRRTARPRPSLDTTIGVVLTDATLTKAQASKVAAVAHDGLARAVRPVHSMTDGDTIFCLASGRRPAEAIPGPPWRHSTRCSARRPTCSPTPASTPSSAQSRGPWRSYAELAPCAVTG